MRIAWISCDEPTCPTQIAIDGMILAYVPMRAQLVSRGWQWISDMHARCPKHIKKDAVSDAAS